MANDASRHFDDEDDEDEELAAAEAAQSAAERARENEIERCLDLLRSQALQMMEHGGFDAVQLFATKHDPAGGGTIVLHYGEGNWYARYGQVKEWVVRREAEAQEESLFRDKD